MEPGKLVFLLLMSVCAVRTQTDRTREENTSGSYVVDAVINTLDQACIFADDRFYLRRLAYVESKDGTDPKTYRPSYDGGIWQVDRDKFEQTKTQASKLSSQYQTISNKLNIDWSTVTWSDLRKPLYSGLAAALYYESQGDPDFVIPDTVDNQGILWQRTYRQNKTPVEFVSEANQLQSSCYRNEDVDIVFMVPSTSDMRPSDYEAAKDFVSKMVTSNLDKSGKVHVAMVSYSNKPRLEFGLASADPAIITAAVARPSYMGGSRDTATAITFVYKNVFNQVNKARPQAARVVVLITEGASNDNIRTVTESVKAKTTERIIFYVVAVGDKVDADEIKLIATQPSCAHVYRVHDFSNLKTLNPIIAALPCRVPTVLSAGEYTYPCGSNILVQIRSISVGTSIKISTGNGTVDVYGSYSNPLPTIDSHDVAHTVTPSDPAAYYSKDKRPLTISVNSQKNQGLKCFGNFKVKVEDAVSRKSDCNGHKPDIEFLVDLSQTRSPADVNYIKDFLTKFVDHFDVGPNQAQVGLVTYADTPTNQFWLNQHQTKSAVVNAIRTAVNPIAVSASPFGSNMAAALEFVRQNAFTAYHGARADSSKVLVLVAEGTPSLPQPVLKEAALLHNLGVRVVSIAIGSNFNDQVLNALGSGRHHVEHVPDFSALGSVASKVITDACGSVQIVCLEQGLQRNCSIEDLLSSVFKPVVIPDRDFSPNPCRPILPGTQPITRFPHPLNNDSFLLCDNKGEVYVVLCPSGERYDPIRRDCEKGSGVITPPALPRTTPTTVPPTTPTSTPTTPATTQTSLPPNNLNGCLSNPCTPDNLRINNLLFACQGDPTKYITCSNIPFKASVENCPPKKIWENNQKICSYPYVVTNPSTGDMANSLPNPCRGNTVAFYPVAGDPREYIKCNNAREGYLMRCPDPKIWNTIVDACDDP